MILLNDLATQLKVPIHYLVAFMKKKNKIDSKAYAFETFKHYNQVFKKEVNRYNISDELADLIRSEFINFERPSRDKHISPVKDDSETGDIKICSADNDYFSEEKTPRSNLNSGVPFVFNNCNVTINVYSNGDIDMSPPNIDSKPSDYVNTQKSREESFVCEEKINIENTVLTKEDIDTESPTSISKEEIKDEYAGRESVSSGEVNKTISQIPSKEVPTTQLDLTIGLNPLDDINKEACEGDAINTYYKTIRQAYLDMAESKLKSGLVTQDMLDKALKRLGDDVDSVEMKRLSEKRIMTKDALKESHNYLYRFAALKLPSINIPFDTSLFNG